MKFKRIVFKLHVFVNFLVEEEKAHEEVGEGALKDEVEIQVVLLLKNRCHYVV